MTAPVFLAEDLTPDRIALTGAEGRHAATVRRLRVGEQVDLVDGRGGRAACEVRVVARDTVELRVVRRTSEPEPEPRLVLVQAIAKGDRGELAVELATELGVDEVVPWSAERCVTRWEGERGARALARWRSTAREAGKQSRRAWLPQVTEPTGTSALSERVHAAAAAFVLHQSALEPLPPAAELPGTGDVLLVVGPEGGISDSEVERLTAAGGRSVRLGPTVLRTSTAGAAALAVLSAGTRWR